MKKFGGKVFFINRDNVNTDEIIPAKYLTEIEKEPLKPHLLEDLKIDEFDPTQIKWDEYSVVISRENFGSGSSREMAVWAFEVNNINTIIAANFARIFRENAFNDGMLAIELGTEKINEIFDQFGGYFSKGDPIEANIDIDKGLITLKSEKHNIEKVYEFKLDKLEKDLILAGGWVKLAAQKY
ncbi:MAG: 3-isopropylmalate dehydratase small subunit [Promethearchaeota archaeon]